jgi:hypothetical protein
VDVDERRSEHQLEHQQDAMPPRGMSNPGPVVHCLGSQKLIDSLSEGSSSTVRMPLRVPSAISSESYGIRLGMLDGWPADPIRLADSRREV